MEEDPVRNLRAGECICKENVNGVRCDRCKDGFFNLQQDNLQGCEGKWYNSIDGEGGVDCSGDDGDDGGNDNGDYFDGGGYGNQ
jgi:coxsackievirus/adenovirus receptor